MTPDFQNADGSGKRGDTCTPARPGKTGVQVSRPALAWHARAGELVFLGATSVNACYSFTRSYTRNLSGVDFVLRKTPRNCSYHFPSCTLYTEWYVPLAWCT